MFIFLGMSNLSAQTRSFETLKNLKEKSDADILNEKKSVKISTWEKRGLLYLDISQVNTRNIWKGMATEGLQGAKTLQGDPNKILAQGNKEQWQYDRINLNFIDGVLDNWEETEVIDHEALIKSYNAYEKARELDTKGKFKKKMTTKQYLSALRGHFVNKGLDQFAAEDFVGAKKSLATSLNIYETYPRLNGDTSYRAGIICYYTAVMAENAKETDDAIKYYKKTIEYNYLPAKCFHYVALVYKSNDDDVNFLATVKEGFANYPESADLIIDLINYYLNRGEREEALAYLDKGLKADPENATFYFAKGTVYDKMTIDTVLVATDEEKEEYLLTAKKCYETAIEKDDQYFNAYFNLAVYYNNRAAVIQELMTKIPLKEAERYEKEKANAKKELENALPYIEKAYEINPKDRAAIRTLISINRSLGNYKKANELQIELENLPVIE